MVEAAVAREEAAEVTELASEAETEAPGEEAVHQEPLKPVVIEHL